jgi:hypothetical protein
MTIERIFPILAVILIGSAAFCVWRGQSDTAFVLGVLGACAFFLGIRFQIKSRLNDQAIDDADERGDEDADDS